MAARGRAAFETCAMPLLTVHGLPLPLLSHVLCRLWHRWPLLRPVCLVAGRVEGREYISLFRLHRDLPRAHHAAARIVRHVRLHRSRQRTAAVERHGRCRRSARGRAQVRTLLCGLHCGLCALAHLLMIVSPSCLDTGTALVRTCTGRFALTFVLSHVGWS